MYSPKAIANAFLELSGKEKRQLTQMKLHKLIYYAHGWNLGLLDNPLIDETVEAWKYGPVIRSLYYEFRDVGSAPIDRMASEVKITPGTTKIQILCPEVSADDEDTVALLQRTWEVYGNLSATQLSKMTHEPDSPWSKTWEKAQAYGVVKGVDIPNDLIRDYFRQKAEANRAQKTSAS